MNGVHDLGGMHGFGPVIREENEPVFHAPWEGHVLAMMRLSIQQGLFNLDAFRYGIERMEPVHYLSSSYYEHWLASVETNLIEHGIVTKAELDARTQIVREQPDFVPHQSVERAPPRLSHGESTGEPTDAATARFRVGDRVVARNLHPTSHTRLPRYVRGKQGVIERVHAPEIFPDTNAHGPGAPLQSVYSVRFTGRELWGEAGDPRQSLSIDLWEQYLDPA